MVSQVPPIRIGAVSQPCIEGLAVLARHYLSNLEPQGLHYIAMNIKHHLALMYRHSKNPENLDNTRPEVTLRNNNKVKFKIKTTKLTKVQKSPYFRRVSLWDQLPEDVQRATTKVKDRQL